MGVILMRVVGNTKHRIKNVTGAVVAPEEYENLSNAKGSIVRVARTEKVVTEPEKTYQEIKISNMSMEQIQEFVRLWNAGQLPGMKLGKKTDWDALEKAKRELIRIAKIDFEAWQPTDYGPGRGAMKEHKGRFIERAVYSHIDQLIRNKAASIQLIKQYKIAQQLREAIPLGPSYKAKQKYEQGASERGPDILFPATRGIDTSRKILYKIIGRPERLISSYDTYILYYKYRYGRVRFEVFKEMFDNDCIRFFSGQVSFY